MKLEEFINKCGHNDGSLTEGVREIIIEGFKHDYWDRDLGYIQKVEKDNKALEARIEELAKANVELGSTLIQKNNKIEAWEKEAKAAHAEVLNVKDTAEKVNKRCRELENAIEHDIKENKFFKDLLKHNGIQYEGLLRGSL